MIERHNFPGEISVVFSEHTRDRLTRQGIKNVIRIYPPVGEPHPDSGSNPCVVCRQFGIGKRSVLCATHYGPASGIAEIIRAIAALPSDFDDVVLVLASRTQPGQDRLDEEQRVREVARDVGVEDRLRIIDSVEDMPALIRACSVTVLVPGKLSSKMDLPLIVLESLALGRPAIVADNPPICEALLGGAGCTVAYQDIPQLTNAIAEIVSHPKHALALGQKGQQAIRELCDPMHVIDTYQDVFDQARTIHDA
jgi:glycosyltransferase involved in cell wall biosynthesis